MLTQKKPPIPISGVIYGGFIYWCTCISATIVVFGTIKSFLEGSSDIPVEQLLDAVFTGQSADAVWASLPIGSTPNARTYLSLLDTGEATTVLGICFGVLSVGPAIFLSAAFMWRSKNKFFAITALFSGVFAVIAPFAFFLI
jgi:hypothetical protein